MNAKTARFSPDEILATHHRYVERRRKIEAGELGWDSLADFFTDDATFVDPAWGRVDGKDNIIKFLAESMEGLEDWTFPLEWELVDGDCLVTGFQNRLPGRRADGSYYQAPGVSRIVYAGGGKFSFEQDLLNMPHILELIKESGWMPKKAMNAPPRAPRRLCAWTLD
jgi:ketosteroid isomerase-like protein